MIAARLRAGTVRAFPSDKRSQGAPPYMPPLVSSTSGDVTVVRHAGDEEAAIRAEHWPINWSAIWVGTLAALAIALIVSLAGAALGAHQLGPGGRIASWKDVGFGALVFSVVGAFAAFVVGGWVAGKINGFRRAETDMLHGAIVWLVAVPIFVGLAAFGAGNFFGTWFGGLAGPPVFVTPSSNVAADPNAATAARNAALGAVTGLLIGLVGSVVGGWMASGEPMTLSYHNLTRGAQRRDGVTAPHR